jgi:hypothetical protein
MHATCYSLRLFVTLCDPSRCWLGRFLVPGVPSDVHENALSRVCPTMPAGKWYLQAFEAHRFSAPLRTIALITREQFPSSCLYYAINSNIGYNIMSLFCLPKELRLQIWSLVYFSQPPRLVTLRTKSHDEAHNEDIFCPRYSPTPAPVAAYICHESRAEASYQARKARQIIRLHQGSCDVASKEPPGFMEEFYFRFETDILYLPLEDTGVKHFDDSPEVGLLRHFRVSVDGDAALLRNVAVTQVINSGIRDGSLSNTLREFPRLSRIIMVVPDNVERSQLRKSLFVEAACRIMALYKFDTSPDTWLELDYATKPGTHTMDFAMVAEGKLEIIPQALWKDWTKPDQYDGAVKVNGYCNLLGRQSTQFE